MKELCGTTSYLVPLYETQVNELFQDQALIINPEYKVLIPEPSLQEYQQLKSSIQQEGIYHPIVINEHNEILDGHTRYKICQELGIPIKITVRQFADKLLEKRFVIESNLSRRHLNAYQKAELGVPLLAIERKLAKQRQGTRTDLDETSLPNGRNLSRYTRQSTTQVAKKIGLSGRNFQRALYLMENASEGLKVKLRNGNISINAAEIQARRAVKHAEPPQLPEGQFDVLYADPPWLFDFSLEGDPQAHYPTMPVKDICALQVPVTENAILFLWVPNAKLPDGLRVMSAWGFLYVTNLVWVKNTKGLGYYSMGQHELLLIGKKGDIPPPEARNRPLSVITAKRGRHSHKPASVYTIIEQMYPQRQYLELFARQTRNGWTSWGDEIASDTHTGKSGDSD
jgi:N6-adenosine-specific RNA methylase IME4